MNQATDKPSSSVAQRAVRGVAWMLPTSLGSRLVGLVGTLVLARYLAPGEYGEVSAASIVALTASMVSTFGIGIYLVANRDLSRAETFHASCWYLAAGFVAICVAWLLRGPLGTWSNAPMLGHFLPVFLLSTLLDRVSFLPERMLVRALRFRRLSLARAASELAYTAVSLALAMSGVGAMAIAWGNLTRSALRFLSIVPAVDWREWLEPHRLHLATMLKIVRYGITVSGTSIANYAMSRWDNLLVSRYFGPAAMGAYNYAYNLAESPSLVGEQIGDVVGASFPHLAVDKRESALVRSFTTVSLIMLPLAFGLGGVSETAAQTFFDRRWSNIGTMLLMLSVLSALKPMTYILHSYMYAGGRTKTVLCLEWLGLATIVTAIATVGRIGMVWTCGAVSAAYVGRMLIALWTLQVADSVPMSRFLWPLARPLATCAAMVAAIMLARPGLQGLAAGVRLVLEISLGASVYVLGAFLVFPADARELLRLARSALSRK